MAMQAHAVKGELDAVPLMQFLPVLERRRMTGLLTVERGPKRRTFEVVKGEVVSASSADPREYLGQMLVDCGLLSSETAARAFWHQETTRVLLGKLLPLRGALEESRVREVLTLKIREELLDCCRWEYGDLCFQSCAPRPSRGLEVRVRLSEVYEEAQRRAEQWRAFELFFPDPDLPLRTVAGAPMVELEPDELVLLDLAAEGRTVAEAFGAFRDGDYQVMRRLLSLVQKGQLRPVDPSPLHPRPASAGRLLENAEALLRAGRPAEAAAMAARAAEHAPSRVALRVLREAQVELALRLADELLSIEGEPCVLVDERELARLDLQPAERYVLMRVEAMRDLREAVRDAPMGELEALRILQRLVDGKVLGFRPAADDSPAARERRAWLRNRGH